MSKSPETPLAPQTEHTNPHQGGSDSPNMPWDGATVKGAHSSSIQAYWCYLQTWKTYSNNCSTPNNNCWEICMLLHLRGGGGGSVLW